MANTFIAISTVTVGSGGAANIEFTSIPATFTDLFILLSTRTATGGATDARLEFNNDTTAANYTGKQLTGSGSGALVSNTLVRDSIDVTGSTDTASVFGSGSIYIPNYLSSNQKSYSIDSVTENNASTAYAAIRASKHTGTSSITSMKFTLSSAANFAQYSTATLYGIKSS